MGLFVCFTRKRDPRTRQGPQGEQQQMGPTHADPAQVDTINVEAPGLQYHCFQHIVETVLEHAPYESLITWRSVCRDFCTFIDRLLAYDLWIKLEPQFSPGASRDVTWAVVGYSNRCRSSSSRYGAHPRFMPPRVPSTVDPALFAMTAPPKHWSFLASARYVLVTGFHVGGMAKLDKAGAFLPLVPHLTGVQRLSLGTIGSDSYDDLDVCRVPIKAHTVRVLRRPYKVPHDASYYHRGQPATITYPPVTKAELQFSRDPSDDCTVWNTLHVVLPSAVKHFSMVFEEGVLELKPNADQDFVKRARVTFDTLVRSVATVIALAVPHVKCEVVGIDTAVHGDMSALLDDPSAWPPRIGLKEILCFIVYETGCLKSNWSYNAARAYVRSITFRAADKWETLA